MSAALALALSLALPHGAASLTFDEAIGLADEAPEITGARRAAAIKRRRREALPRLQYNPQAYLQPGLRLRPAESEGFELQGGITQTWSVSGLHRRQRESLDLEAEVFDADARYLALERRLAAARAWIDLWAAQALLEEARREAGIAATFAATIERAQSLEAATMADVAEAGAYRSEAELMVLAAEGEIFHLGLLLARETARPSSEPLQAAGDLPRPVLPPPGAWPNALAEAEALPAVAVRTLASQAESARAAEVKAMYGTTLTTGLLFQHDQPGGFVGYAFVGVNVPLFNRGQRSRADLMAAAEREAGAAADAAIAARVDLAMIFHEVEHTAKVEAELRDRMVPALDAGAGARQRLFDAGHATVIEVLLARRQAIGGRARLHRAAADHAWARVKAWLLLATIERQRGRK